MRKLIQLFALISLTLVASNAYAIPELQLNIPGGIYVNDFDGDSSTVGPFDEGIVTNASNFNLQAFLKHGLDANVGAQTYYISTALLNSDGTAADIGSLIPNISINGTPIGTASWIYGTPSDLPTHGVFPTYYYPITFNYSTGEFVANGIFNIADASEGSTDGYIHTLSFNIDSIGANQALVFDLFAYETNPSGKSKVIFAPFSHNATTTSHTPEPASLTLLGLGLLGLTGLGRKKRK